MNPAHEASLSGPFPVVFRSFQGFVALFRLVFPV